MRVTVITEDGVVGVNGVFRAVDLSGTDEDIRAIQWDGTAGHIELFGDNVPNEPLDSIAPLQTYIDLWTAAAPIPPLLTPSELIAQAHARIAAAYEASVNAVIAGYPANEIASWPKQETEARAYLADNAAPTPWIDSAAQLRGITKAELVTLILANADALSPVHGALTGKRQKLRDQIDALGESATSEQLDAIQW